MQCHSTIAVTKMPPLSQNQHICEVSEAVAEKMYEERTQILDEQERQEFETLTTDLHHLVNCVTCDP